MAPAAESQVWPLPTKSYLRLHSTSSHCRMRSFQHPAPGAFFYQPQKRSHLATVAYRYLMDRKPGTAPTSCSRQMWPQRCYCRHVGPAPSLLPSLDPAPALSYRGRWGASRSTASCCGEQEAVCPGNPDTGQSGDHGHCSHGAKSSHYDTNRQAAEGRRVSGQGGTKPPTNTGASTSKKPAPRAIPGGAQCPHNLSIPSNWFRAHPLPDD